PTTGIFSSRAQRAARVAAAVSWPSTSNARAPRIHSRRRSFARRAMLGTRFHRTVRPPDFSSTRMKALWLMYPGALIQFVSTPSRAISSRWNSPAASSAIFPTYRTRSPHRLHATIALATCPPAFTDAEMISTFESRAGKWGRRMIVSVALIPTPTTSTPGDFFFAASVCPLEALYLSLTLSNRGRLSSANYSASSFIICAACCAVIKKIVWRALVGAPTPHATPRIRSHRPAELRAGRSRPHRQFSLAQHGTRSRRGCRRAPHQEPPRLHARAPLACPHLVLRTRESRARAHQSVRADRIFPRCFWRLRFRHRPRIV